MQRIELRRYIHAPRDRVWEIITDLTGQRRWMEDLHSLKVVSQVQEGPGAVIHVRSKLFRLPVLRDVMEVTAWDAPHRLDIVHRGQFTGSGSFLLLPGKDDGTVFIWEEIFDPPFGSLGDFIADRVVSPHLRRVWGRSMDNVKRLVEAAPEA